MANKRKYEKKKTFVAFLSKNFGLGVGLKNTMSSFLGLNIRFRRVLRLRAKHILIVKKKTGLMDFGSIKKQDIRERVLLLIRIKAYRGMRHKMKHPSRGQRTHTNGKTKKKFRY
jgi:small subunit ribosomal protein S13